jgi:hypothetical protein
MSEENTTAEAAPSKRPRKLTKEIEGTKIILNVVSVDEALTFTLDQFSPDIQEKLAMYGISQKLGDAAAGKDGQEAVDAINKVAEGLIKGDWTIRAPAAPKVTKAQINENLSNMSDKDRAAAEELLKKLGINA